MTDAMWGMGIGTALILDYRCVDPVPCERTHHRQQPLSGGTVGTGKTKGRRFAGFDIRLVMRLYVLFERVEVERRYRYIRAWAGRAFRAVFGLRRCVARAGGCAGWPRNRTTRRDALPACRR